MYRYPFALRDSLHVLSPLSRRLVLDASFDPKEESSICPVARRRANATQTTKHRREYGEHDLSDTRHFRDFLIRLHGSFYIYIYIIRLYGFHDANTKYEIVTAGLSVYGLAQAPRLHFSLHVVSIVIFSLIFALKTQRL